ncbi:endoplasmic reticulum resident protein 44-like [Dysidea avara]|uniref:endoplasmic reticulum resident protein 44-like n=1 Tax=Dysidea avara TaxID=196820 RepID=UPI0033341E05
MWGFILLITIDSFRHMYMFPGTIEDIHKMKQFLDDLHSDKLHRGIHHELDPIYDCWMMRHATSSDDASRHTAPPRNTFMKLDVSHNNYIKEMMYLNSVKVYVDLARSFDSYMIVVLNSGLHRGCYSLFPVG